MPVLAVGQAYSLDLISRTLEQSDTTTERKQRATETAAVSEKPCEVKWSWLVRGWLAARRAGTRVLMSLTTRQRETIPPGGVLASSLSDTARSRRRLPPFFGPSRPRRPDYSCGSCLLLRLLLDSPAVSDPGPATSSPPPIKSRPFSSAR